MRLRLIRKSQSHRPVVERCEERILNTLIFVLNGNAYSAAVPTALTANAARVLQGAGHQVVQLPYPTIATPGDFYAVANRIAAISNGRPIALVGFSAGGTLATRLSGVASLNVKAVLNNYGPPDLRQWLQYHGRDVFGQYVRSRVPFTPATIDLLSGPSQSKAYIVSAFGTGDRNVRAAQSLATATSDFAVGRTYTYRGGHGVSINASRPALEDFLAHL